MMGKMIKTNNINATSYTFPGMDMVVVRVMYGLFNSIFNIKI